MADRRSRRRGKGRAMRHVDFLSQPAAIAPLPYRPFVKMHGLQNHFVIMDQRSVSRPFDVADIVRICDPHIGVGGEQLLTIEKPSREGREAGAYARMRIFNIDGREVGACGNATRCMAHLLLEETGTDEVSIETAAGVLHCREAGPMSVSVTLGPISADWRLLPAAHEVDTFHLPVESGPLRDGAAFHIGNPHAVFFVERLDPQELTLYAPAIQNHPLFPEGINVGAAQVIDSKTLRLAVWERPGILTRACGTGACIAAYAALKRGLVSAREIEVQLPAGALKIGINDDATAVMTGPVAFCCHGFVEGDW